MRFDKRKWQKVIDDLLKYPLVLHDNPVRNVLSDTAFLQLIQSQQNFADLTISGWIRG